MPLPRLRVQLGAVDGAVSAAALRVVHRHVGAAHQRLRVGAVLGEHRDADARADLAPRSLDDERRLERAEDFLADAQRGPHVARGRKDEGELVAAEARDRVGLAHQLPEARGDLLQHDVAAVVAERVVDLLEPVQIEKHQSDRLSAPARDAHRLVHPVEQERPVRKAREHVVERLLLERRHLRLALAHVPQVGDPVHHLVRRAVDRDQQDLDEVLGAVPPVRGRFSLERGALREGMEQDVVDRALALAGAEDLERLADHFLARGAAHPAERLVDEENLGDRPLARRGEDDDPVGRVLDREPRELGRPRGGGALPRDCRADGEQVGALRRNSADFDGPELRGRSLAK